MDAGQWLCRTHHRNRNRGQRGRPFGADDCRANALMTRRTTILIWITVFAATSLFVSHLRIDTDMAAFLPRSASPVQRVLVDQFRDGVVSRLVLIAIEGVPPDHSATISRLLAARLRGNGDFVTVENGEASGFQRDRDFLWSSRYLLS